MFLNKNLPKYIELLIKKKKYIKSYYNSNKYTLY